MPKPDGENIPAHLPPCEILQALWQNLPVIQAACSSYFGAHDLPNPAILHQLPEFLHYRRDAALHPDHCPYLLLPRKLDQVAGMLQVLCKGPLAIHCLPGCEAGPDRLVVHVDARAAYDELYVRVLGEIGWRSVGARFLGKTVRLDGGERCLSGRVAERDDLEADKTTGRQQVRKVCGGRPAGFGGCGKADEGDANGGHRGVS